MRLDRFIEIPDRPFHLHNNYRSIDQVGCVFANNTAFFPD